VVTHEKVDVIEKELGLVGVCAQGVLAWVAQEKEGKAHHVSNSPVGYGGRRTSETEVLGGSAWYSPRCRLERWSLRYSGEGIGPQSGESPAHRMDRGLRGSRPDLPLAGGNTLVAVALGEELEDCKKVGPAIQKRCQILKAELAAARLETMPASMALPIRPSSELSFIVALR
jgi:hypothetical protein